MSNTRPQGWFLTGLLLTTLATLALEILGTRLLSVTAWYHFSFFAVSVAMFGMTAGAVRVYLGGAEFEGDAALRQLARYGTLLAVAIVLSHFMSLVIRIPIHLSTMTVAALIATTLVLAIPFYLSGVIVAVALTRVPGRIGTIYAVDLGGAALGCLLVLPLLQYANISSAAFVCGGLAALGAFCFRRHAKCGGGLSDLLICAGLVVAAVANATTQPAVRVLYSKGQVLDESAVFGEYWSIHGRVIANHPIDASPFYYGPGKGAPQDRRPLAALSIDGGAATAIIEFDGRPESLDWIGFDVTSLPYHLRPGGAAGIIGVGGGRDVLSAIWARSTSITGIEVNRALIDLLEGPFRELGNLAGRPELTLVHDEARSYLTRTSERFDVLQMSLIDTWAATGAGAFTLTENGLYTLEAWKVFLGTLQPGGIFSVSRWYSPDSPFETARLVSLATSSLIERGVADPSRHLALIGRGRIATLLTSVDPFTDADLAELDALIETMRFRPIVVPGHPPADELLGAIASSRTHEELTARVADEAYDYLPSTDERPFFFNLLKPGALAQSFSEFETDGVLAGNFLATATLAILLGIVLVLVLLTVLGPLARSGLPRLDAGSFAMSVTYFAAIGAGYMFLQMGLIQRFSIYLGHPVYSVAVVLFSMILLTGVGSLLTDRIAPEKQAAWARVLALCTAVALLAVSFALQPMLESTIERSLLVRCAVALFVVGPIALLLGTFFPLGMHLVRRLSDDALPWMWGVNGAAGVLASVAAIAISMWWGISRNLHLAALAYALLVVPIAVLAWKARANATATEG